MPWTTPTLKQVRGLVRDYVLSQLGARAMIPNSALRIMSDAKAGLAHLVLLFIDWLSKQLLPDTAETEWLDRHGAIWLKNADGSKGRKAPAAARGTVTLTTVEGTGSIVVPQYTAFKSATQVEYRTDAEAVVNELGAAVAMTAFNAGAAGNLEPGEVISLVTNVENLTGTGIVVTMTGGTDEENDDDLRERTLLRIQQPPMGGDADDYVQWALSVPGVTRAWSAPLEMGIGTVTVRVMMDDLRSEEDGFPNADDIATVQEYIDKVRPVAIKDRWVLAPIPEPVDLYITELESDTVAIRAAIEIAIRDKIREVAAPAHAINGVVQEAQTIYSAWISEAIASVPGVRKFRLTMEDHEMPTPGHIGILGSIIYG